MPDEYDQHHALHEHDRELDTQNCLTRPIDPSLFGNNVSKNKQSSAPPLQEDMIQTWNSIIENELDSQEKTTLLEKYPVPENAPLLNTPKLNGMLEKMVLDSVKQRDNRLMKLQTQISTSIYWSSNYFHFKRRMGVTDPTLSRYVMLAACLQIFSIQKLLLARTLRAIT